MATWLASVIDGHILRDIFLYGPFDQVHVHVGRLFAREDKQKALLDVAVLGSGHILIRQIAFRQVFRGMRHLPVADGLVNDLMDLVRRRTEDGTGSARCHERA